MLSSRRGWREIGKGDSVNCLPIVGGDHFDCVPGTAIEKRAVRSFADAFLTSDTKIWINLNPAKGRMIFVRYPEHAGFDWAILDARRRTGAARAAVRGNGEDAWALLSRCLAVAL